tara:strand:- start:74 stop:322 length:249 start_codon:yes stop_codon:yes gene_type:complete
MFSVNFDPLALKFLEKQEKQIAKRIWDKVQSTKENPYHYFEKLVGRLDFRLRVGDYRVLADIDQSSNTIQVTVIGHRKDIYK